MANRPLQCVVSISGIRGIVGDTLQVDQVLALGAAFGTVISARGTVVLGRDTRPTGALLAQAVAAGLRAVGCDVIDIGVVPTPTVPIMVQEFSASGGIMVSASHNPVEWNALKFFNALGRNVDQGQLDWILEAYHDVPIGAFQRWDTVGSYREDRTALDLHRHRVLDAVDRPLIRKAALRVAIDSVNGSGSVIAPSLLASLGCAVVPINASPDLVFPRDPEPTAANVREFGGVVRAVGAAVGFVQDPDADRLAVIDETGRYIGEEYTLVLCAAARFAAAQAEGRTGAVACTNLSTSRMLDDVAARHGGRVVRTRVGEANVVDAMVAERALIGGEGNGGVIDPRVVMGRDSQVAMALIVELLARSGQTMSELVAAIPSYAIHKTKIALDRKAVTAAIPKVQADAFASGAAADLRDGLKLAWNDRWVHLRASGTEPVSRIIAEAPTAAEAEDLCERLRRLIGAEAVVNHGHG